MVSRAKLSLSALVLTVVTMGGLVPWVLLTVSLPLMSVWIGMPICIAAVTLTRVWADGGRAVAGQLTRRPILRPYREIPRGTRMFSRLRILLSDPATWRDYLWILLACVPGYVLVVVSLALTAAPLFFLVYPLLLAVTPPEIFSQPFGPLVTFTHWSQGFWTWPVAGVLFVVWWFAMPGLMAGWTGMARGLLSPTRAAELEGRVTELWSSRAETRDSAADELRRIERDLHDGVQVKLASLGMSLGLIEQLLDSDPQRARQLLAEASAATTNTMEDLRAVVRGIHPPMLADRGLVGAIEALALDLAIPCTVTVEGFADAQRVDAPVESCLYFGIAEALANVVKHSRARRVEVTLHRSISGIQATVTDDGIGGAHLDAGSGLVGIQRRLRAFDGTLRVESPIGGPTVLTLELPCEPSSPRTTPFSAKD